MPLTFAEAFKKLEESLQQRATWNEVVDILSRFVDHEVKEASQGIAAEGCVSKYVPQEVIKEIVAGIESEKIAPLDEVIDTLRNMQVTETNDGEEEKPAKEKPKRGKKKAKKKRRQSVRIVSRPAHQKAGGS